MNEKEEKHEVPKRKVVGCIVKNTKKARMLLINTHSSILKHKDQEHLERYEKLWALHDNNYPKFLTSTYHNITKDEFRDFVLLMKLSHYEM